MTVLGAIPLTDDLAAGAHHTPAGVMMPFGGSAAPTGWALCNGALVSQATFPALFAAIAHRYNGGVDPGSGNFRLPDMRGAMALGKSGAETLGSGASGGLVGGARGHTHGPGGLVMDTAHQHPAGTLIVSYHAHGHSLAMPDHGHPLSPVLENIQRAGTFQIGRVNAGYTGSPNTTAMGGGIAGSAAGVGGSTGGSGGAGLGGATAAADPPFQVVNYLIKT